MIGGRWLCIRTRLIDVSFVHRKSIHTKDKSMGKKKGRLITVEGTEGVGKSTVISAIVKALAARSIESVLTREPGGTPIAEAVRGVLLQDHEEAMIPMTELLLMFASRAQHIATLVEPALARGEWVISDRYTDASFAYQGGGRSIPVAYIEQLAEWTQGDCVPDITVLLDAPVVVGLERMEARGGKDRIEKEGVEFFERIRETYLQMAVAQPERFCVVDAAQTEELVIADTLVALEKKWDNWL